MHEFIAKHEVVFQNIRHLFKNNNTGRLVVIFSGATRNYNLLKGLMNDVSHDYLWIYENDLIGDDYFRWYSDQVYKDVLEHYLTMYSAKKICLVGSSMGGYASLKYCIQLSIRNLIIRAPQVNLEIARKYFTMSKVTNFLDISGELGATSIDRIYYETPNFLPDTKQLSIIKKIIDSNSRLKIYNQHSEEGHLGGMWNDARVLSVLNFFNI